MNAVGMFPEQAMPMSNYQDSISDKSTNEQPFTFEGILFTKKAEDQTGDLPLDNQEPVDIDTIRLHLSNLPQNKLEELYTIIFANKEIEGQLREVSTSSETAEALANLLVNENSLEIEEIAILIRGLDVANGEDEDGQIIWSKLLEVLRNGSHFQIPDQSIQANYPYVVKAETNVKQQFVQLFAQVEALLVKTSNEEDMIKEAPKILELLQKWTNLERKYPSGSSQQGEIETKEVRLWKDLLHSFQRRNQLAIKQQYNTDAKVTSKDIAKWLTNRLNTQTILDSATGSQQVNLSSMPMSKLEQYVIHINQPEGSINKQLIEQFQNVMKTSRFLAMNNGVNHLSIALRPDNLGEMIVRLTQINGDMTLKIIVSSQATRQMLETNIHQLKNMFSPHQVIIEEQEVDVQNIDKEQEEKPMENQEEDQSQQSNKNDAQDAEGDFETQFQEVIMNEKV